MPRNCSICHHLERTEIDRLLVGRAASIRDIAGRFCLSRSALDRHRTEHLPLHLLKATQAEALSADALLDQVRSLQGKALEILDRADRTGDLRCALGAIQQARGNLQLLARLLGELEGRPTSTVNVLVSPQWVTVRTELIGALRDFPEARSAVAERLVQLEQTG